MYGKPGDPQSANNGDPDPDESVAASSLGGGKADGDSEGGFERFGIVELERLTKDDGRALLVFQRTRGR